ncbi:hypothetical protein D031_3012B, partial [Vibrio parahaemolyticus VP-48]
RLFPWHT